MKEGHRFNKIEAMESDLQVVHLKVAEALGTVHTHETDAFDGDCGQ
jgi:hypothetical protein